MFRSSDFQSWAGRPDVNHKGVFCFSLWVIDERVIGGLLNDETHRHSVTCGTQDRTPPDSSVPPASAFCVER